MNVLVTGGAGFIGRPLVERLTAGGHRVAVVDDGSGGDVRRLHGVSAFLRADVADADLGAFLASTKPEAVVHLAARTDVGESLRAPCRGAEVNVCGTVNVLEHSLAAGVRRFVLASSGGALYGDSAPRPTPETCPARPLSPYGASKAAAEAYVLAMSPPGGMRYTILRYGNVYGPGRGMSGGPGVVSAFGRAMLLGERPVIYGDGLNERDYVHVSDVVKAHLCALHADRDGVFNIGTGTARTVLDVFAAVARAAGFGGDPVHTGARAGEQRRSCLDVSRARRVFGWKAVVPFETGVAETVASLRADAGTPAPGCDGPARVPEPAAGRGRETGWRK